MQALVLVDLQYDFMPGGALAVARGDETVAVARAAMPRFDVVVATQDWHPRDHGSFAANHAGKHPGEVIDLHGISQVLWPVHCVQGTRGAELHDELDRARIARVFRKGSDRAVDSYSGFFDNGRRGDTGLHAWLRERGVDHLHVMGLATDYCVKHTVLDARSLGYDVALIADGCRAVDLAPGDGDRAIAAMRDAGVTIARADDVAAR
jgi:nicotinamidase/pyrazinamidase